MSAFVVSDKHINFLLNFANKHHYDQRVPQENLSFKVTDHLQKMAEILLAENYKSVNYRYNDGAEPHEIEFNFVWDKSLLEPVQILKACDCYDSQSCETDDYCESVAHKIIAMIRKMAVESLPGYDNAKWEIV